MEQKSCRLLLVDGTEEDYRLLRNWLAQIPSHKFELDRQSWEEGVQGSRGAGVQGSRGAGVQGSRGAGECGECGECGKCGEQSSSPSPPSPHPPHPPCPLAPLPPCLLASSPSPLLPISQVSPYLERSPGRSDGVLIVGRNGMVHFANRSAAELSVMSGEELRPLSEVVREKLGMLIIKGNVVQLDGSFLVCELCRGGEKFTGEMMVEETEWAGELAYLVSVRDMTELREAQKALGESEERFRATFEQGVVGICYCDAEGKILWVNQKFCQICGYEEEELRRTTFADLCSTTSLPLTSEQSPEVERSSAPQFRKNSAGEIVESTVEKQCLRKDGSLVWVEMSLSVVREATSTGGADLENRQLGEMKYLVAIVTDISSRKQAEEQLRYRLTLETAVAEISRALVTSAENVDFPEILGWLARAVGANRACLVKFQLERGSTVPASSRRNPPISSIRRSHIDCWHDGEKTSGKNTPATSHMEQIFQALELADLPEPDLMAKFQRSDTAEVSLPLAVADVAALPEQNKKVKRLLQSLNVASLLLVPIAAPQSGQGHQIWGFLCIETILGWGPFGTRGPGDRGTGGPPPKRYALCAGNAYAPATPTRQRARGDQGTFWDWGTRGPGDWGTRSHPVSESPRLRVTPSPSHPVSESPRLRVTPSPLPWYGWEAKLV
ncbi:PAS domain-containing protein [[Phormidium] sp. ETS-05]|uniref:PAS domain-containing protein n=1 Tax=[Phormidium] sp. ETS-05 TaxID=222819 RepID=UPI0018EEF69B|nr:PAS domain S-box protein [[Phormidium] sp. ETS-05]